MSTDQKYVYPKLERPVTPQSLEKFFAAWGFRKLTKPDGTVAWVCCGHPLWKALQ